MLRVFHHYFSGRKLALFLLEGFAIALLCEAGAAILSQVLPPSPWTLPATRLSWKLISALSLGFALSFQCAFYALDLYDLRIANGDRKRGERLLKAVGAAVAVVGGAMIAAPLPLPSGTLLGGVAGALLGAVAMRSVLHSVVGRPARVLLVGNGATARSLTRMVEAHGEDLFTICAQVDAPREGETAHGETLEATAARLQADCVVMALDEPRHFQWKEALLQCRLQGRHVHDAAGFCERVLRRLPVDQLSAESLAFSDDLIVSTPRLLAKRAFDLAMALLLLWQALPTLLLVALAIKLESQGPVFYKQERVGKDGKPYWLWKFRSMRQDAEKDGAVWAQANDARVTRVGRFIRKTRMDEIPQVFNVLKGDMSFVGPRPERPIFVKQLKQQIPFYGLREAVKPGITGWAQIRYPYGASVEDARNKLEFDLYYVKNGSLFLDLAIIFHTVRHVLFGRGAR